MRVQDLDSAQGEGYARAVSACLAADAALRKSLLEGLSMISFLSAAQVAKLPGLAAAADADADRAVEVADLLLAEVKAKAMEAAQQHQEWLQAAVATPVASAGGEDDGSLEVLPPHLMVLPACQTMQHRLLALQDLRSLKVRAAHRCIYRPQTAQTPAINNCGKIKLNSYVIV